MFREWLHDLWLRVRALLKRRQLDRDLADELEFHLAMREQKLIEQGMAPREAHYTAWRGFGNLVSLKETSRDMWSFPSLETFVQDFGYGLRQLRRSPGFTAVAIITLALGIGGTTAIFSVLYGSLLKRLPYKEVGRLAVLIAHDPSQPGLEEWWGSVTPAAFLDLREQNHVFDQVVGGWQEDMVLAVAGQPAGWFSGNRVTPNTFQVLGMAPLIGRGLTSDDAKPGAPPVVVLSYRALQGKFGGNLGIVGRTIVLNRQPTTVIGVMPPGFTWSVGGDDSSGWLPAVFSKGINKDQSQWSPVVGHLKPGVTIAQASAEMAVIVGRLAAANPKDYPKGVTFSVGPLGDFFVLKQTRLTLLVLMGGVGLLLLIACVNVANLLLARATRREKEFAVRASLGAGRVRLVRQLLIESWLLALGGAILGSLLAWNCLNALVAVLPTWFLRSGERLRMNGWVMLFALGMAVVSTLLFGLAPAVLGLGKGLHATLESSGRGVGETLGRIRLRNLLMVSEVTLSLVLLTGACLLFRSFWALCHLELGYNPDNVLSAWLIGLPEERYKTAEQRNQMCIEALRRIRALPGVESAALSWASILYAFPTEIAVVGQPAAQKQSTWYRPVGDRYFETLRIPLLQGRTISEDDIVDARTVVVVNRAFVKKYFAGQNPLGRQVKVLAPSSYDLVKKDTVFEIVGVVGDTAHSGFDLNPTVQPQVFLTATAVEIPDVSFLVRTAGDPAPALNLIRREIAAIDKELPVLGETLREERLKYWYSEPRFVLGMLIGFAALGMTLGCIGVYSVLSYAVSQRTHEIGVRMALGAEPRDVRWWVLKSGLRWLLVGVGIGVPTSIALAKVFQNRIWGIKSADPLTLVVVALVMTAVGLAACYFPARRATKLDPLVALRYE